MNTYYVPDHPDNLRVIAERAICVEPDTIRFYADCPHAKRRTVATPMFWKEVERGIAVEPFLRLGLLPAQALMDSLWDCGIRPTQGKGSAGQLEAVKYHLEDMRGIAHNAMV